MYFEIIVPRIKYEHIYYYVMYEIIRIPKIIFLCVGKDQSAQNIEKLKKNGKTSCENLELS